MHSLRIDRRFCGPPESGNGGYVAGLLARAFGGSDCAVTLHRPPPLDMDLQVVVGDGEATLFGGETRLASAIAATPDLTAPEPPTVATALAVEPTYKGFSSHIFSTCFVCGPARAAGDGLRIFAGTLPGEATRVAAHWRPASDLAGDDGLVEGEYLWAALDCPGYFAVEHESGPAVLGRMTARIHRRPAAGASIVVSGWAIDHSGRKHVAGTALHTVGGELVAIARSVWISLKT